MLYRSYPSWLVLRQPSGWAEFQFWCQTTIVSLYACKAVGVSFPAYNDGFFRAGWLRQCILACTKASLMLTPENGAQSFRGYLRASRPSSLRSYINYGLCDTKWLDIYAELTACITVYVRPGKRNLYTRGRWAILILLFIASFQSTRRRAPCDGCVFGGRLLWAGFVSGAMYLLAPCCPCRLDTGR
jgi:hypothetical protein